MTMIVITIKIGGFSFDFICTIRLKADHTHNYRRLLTQEVVRTFYIIFRYYYLIYKTTKRQTVDATYETTYETTFPREPNTEQN